MNKLTILFNDGGRVEEIKTSTTEPTIEVEPKTTAEAAPKPQLPVDLGAVGKRA